MLYSTRRHRRFDLRHVDNRLTPIKREINTERDQRSKNRPEHAALAHMKPVRLHLDDRDRAVALEIHVDRIRDRENRKQPHVNPIRQDQPRDDTERDIRCRRPESGDEDSSFAADPVDERAVDQKRERVGHRPRREDEPEIFVRHERAECVLRDREIVASHVKERVGHPEREPIDEPPAQKPRPMFERIIIEINSDNEREADENNAERHEKNCVPAELRGDCLRNRPA